MPHLLQTLGRSWIAGFVIALAALTPSPTLAQDPQTFGIAGNGDMLWIYQSREGDDLFSGVMLVYRTATNGTGNRTHILPLPPVKGKIALAVAVGADLYAFYTSGTHWRYSPPEPAPFASPPKTFFLEAVLPDSALPAALCADDARDFLYAVVPAAVGTKVRAANEARRAMFREDDAPPQQTTAPRTSQERSAQPSPGDASPTPPSDRPLIVRHERSFWEVDRPAPADLSEQAKIAAMLSLGGVIHLLYEPTPDSGQLVHSYSNHTEATWSAPVSLPFSAKAVVVGSGWLDASPALVVAEGPTGGLSINTFVFDAGVWSSRAALRKADNSLALFPEDLSWTFFDSQVAAARLDDQGQVEVGLWSCEDGTSQEPFTVYAPLDAQELKLTIKKIITTAQYIVLFGALAAIFIWRRESVVQEAKLAPGQALASFRGRFLAFLIDMAILLPVCIWTGSGLQEMVAPGVNLVDAIQNRDWAQTPLTVWPVVFGVIYAVYGTVFEMAMRATPGKRLTGCFVVREGGERCGVAAVLLRNFMRLADFVSPPVLLLVAMTRNNQRLGDLFARTLVVQRALQPPAPPESQEEQVDESGEQDEP